MNMGTNYVVCCRWKHENQKEKPVPFGRYPVLAVPGMRVDGSFYTV